MIEIIEVEKVAVLPLAHDIAEISPEQFENHELERDAHEGDGIVRSAFSRRKASIKHVAKVLRGGVIRNGDRIVIKQSRFIYSSDG